VCHIDNANANKHRMDKMSNVLFVMTERGSHCAFFEGLTAKPWASKLIMQYFLALERNLGE
jgi:predicted alpha/beta-fold hydrolase